MVLLVMESAMELEVYHWLKCERRYGACFVAQWEEHLRLREVRASRFVKLKAADSRVKLLQREGLGELRRVGWLYDPPGRCSDVERAW